MDTFYFLRHCQYPTWKQWYQDLIEAATDTAYFHKTTSTADSDSGNTMMLSVNDKVIFMQLPVLLAQTSTMFCWAFKD